MGSGESRRCSLGRTDPSARRPARIGSPWSSKHRPAPKLITVTRTAPERFDAHELQGLPEPVQRYFRIVLTDGQPIIAAATIGMAGTIDLSATTASWKPFTSRQRVVTSAARSRPGFSRDARVAVFPGVNVRVEDSYIAGQGRLTAKLFGLVTLAAARGGGELARGEFMRYFAEAVWYPTALLPARVSGGRPSTPTRPGPVWSTAR